MYIYIYIYRERERGRESERERKNLSYFEEDRISKKFSRIFRKLRENIFTIRVQVDIWKHSIIYTLA